ncbi:hypothetical protein Ga0074812_11230 [Parafrankia irregularis]|uniref:Uncharacterized protein n=1 Tax=Parafrankia irregularis TaxID=795642 RepID=A0A0S4QSC2_9ACTN|nr:MULTISPECIES: hypothetical protein [Parafrankia]MBE3201630.1 hypothetical protein [Parafrankia sp. CH37]CUU57370.1 hypothetical protein Ga0074812_11230 [Parafrankia irregularis]
MPQSHEHPTTSDRPADGQPTRPDTTQRDGSLSRSGVGDGGADRSGPAGGGAGFGQSHQREGGLAAKGGGDASPNVTTVDQRLGGAVSGGMSGREAAATAGDRPVLTQLSDNASAGGMSGPNATSSAGKDGTQQEGGLSKDPQATAAADNASAGGMSGPNATSSAGKDGTQPEGDLSKDPRPTPAADNASAGGMSGPNATSSTGKDGTQQEGYRTDDSRFWGRAVIDSLKRGLENNDPVAVETARQIANVVYARTEGRGGTVQYVGSVDREREVAKTFGMTKEEGRELSNLVRGLLPQDRPLQADYAGRVGSAANLADRETADKINIITKPGSGIGGILAGVVGMRGGTAADMRAAANAGNLVEAGGNVKTGGDSLKGANNPHIPTREAVTGAPR